MFQGLFDEPTKWIGDVDPALNKDPNLARDVLKVTFKHAVCGTGTCEWPRDYMPDFTPEEFQSLKQNGGQVGMEFILADNEWVVQRVHKLPNTPKVSP